LQIAEPSHLFSQLEITKSLARNEVVRLDCTQKKNFIDHAIKRNEITNFYELYFLSINVAINVATFDLICDDYDRILVITQDSWS